MVEERETELEVISPPPKVGMFIRDYLREHSEVYPSEVHREYKKVFKDRKTQKKRTYRVGTYNSFMAYVSKLILAGLIERTGDTQESDNPKAMALEYPERIFIRLTSKGEEAPNFIWMHPLRLWYYPLSWELDEYRDYVKPKPRRSRRRTV